MRKKYITTILLVTTLVSTANNKKIDLHALNDSSKKGMINSNLILEEPKVVCPEDIVIRDFHVLHPAFRNKVVLLFIEAKKQGIDLVISETYRTPERQNMLYNKKLTKVKSGKSKHQYGLAIDLIPVINNKSQANNDEVLKRVGIIGEKLGLKWGGRWKFYDPVHFEYKWNINDALSGRLPEIPDTLIIPDTDFFYKNIKRTNIE